MKEKKRIALICAMEGEARPVIEALGLHEETLAGAAAELYRGTPFRVLRGELESGTEIVLSLNGREPRLDVDWIGLEAATLNTFLTLQVFGPDCVINAGTAGGLAARGAAIADVYLSERAFYFHDHRVPLPGFDELGKGGYPSHDVAALPLARTLGLKTGVVSSGSSLDFPSDDRVRFDTVGATLKDMEAAAIAWVCAMKGTPFFAVKAVTDILDNETPAQEEFLKNFERATRALGRETVRVVSTVATRSI